MSLIFSTISIKCFIEAITATYQISKSCFCPKTKECSGKEINLKHTLNLMSNVE